MKILCRFLLKISGWCLTKQTFPEINKSILIFAPHTSNWDFVTMVVAKFALGIEVRYLGKHSLFQWPIGWFFKALGGLPVTRHENNNVVDQVVQLIDDTERIALALAPEGTRSYRPYWKSGFYHIAKRTKLPIIMFYLDTSTRKIGFSEPFDISGDINQDMDFIRNFYHDKVGYRPKKTSLIQTKKQYIASKRKLTKTEAS